MMTSTTTTTEPSENAGATEVNDARPRMTLQRGKGFLEERPGHKSAMRAMSFCALVAAIAFGFLIVTGSESGNQGTLIVFGFLLAAFAPKTLQKFAEQKLPAYSA